MVKIKSLLFFILTFFRKNVGDIELKMRKGHIRVCRGKCNANLTSNCNQILHNMGSNEQQMCKPGRYKKNPIEKILLEEKFE